MRDSRDRQSSLESEAASLRERGEKGGQASHPQKASNLEFPIIQAITGNSNEVLKERHVLHPAVTCAPLPAQAPGMHTQ